jgi:hypothetical protein
VEQEFQKRRLAREQAQAEAAKIAAEKSKARALMQKWCS